jgi:hypothetical protein
VTKPQGHVPGEAGALGLLVPPEHGGLGNGLDDVGLRGDRRLLRLDGMVFLMHTVTARTTAAGETPGSLAFSERGTHFYPHLVAEPTEGGARRRDGILAGHSPVGPAVAADSPLLAEP